MRTLALLAALTLAGSAVAVSVPELPTCQDPSLAALCIHLVVGDVVVGSGQDEEWSDGTYVVQGKVTVQAGGTFRIIDAQVAAGGQTIMVQVESGGALLIVDSDITGAPAGTPPQIVANASSSVTITDSSFTGMTVVLRTNDAELEGNIHSSSNPALKLEGVTASFSGEQFASNVVAVNVTGGAVTLDGFQFSGDTTAISLYQTATDVRHGGASDVTNGIVATQSEGTYTMLSLDDRRIPPSVGIDLVSTRGATFVAYNDIFEFGTGIRCTDTGGYVTLQSNNFADNGEDVAGDC